MTIPAKVVHGLSGGDFMSAVLVFGVEWTLDLSYNGKFDCLCIDLFCMLRS